MRGRCLMLLILSTTLQADELRIPLGQQGNPQQPMPHHGETQAQVLRLFGPPQNKHPTVGRPPITRWDYPNFSVYFEYQLVLTSVARPTATPQATSDHHPDRSSH